MENYFPILRCPRVAVMDSTTSPGCSGLGARMPQYQEEDMRAIHKAASVGNLLRVRQILLFRKSSLNDRDRMRRTALHVACGKGQASVVRLLARRRFILNLSDNENKTALMHAILHDQEECAAILLDHGANPNVMDIHGNTPLHYAVLGQNTVIVEKLLSCMANPEARNEDDFTPLSLAKYENNEKMVEFLVTSCSEVHQMEGDQQPTSEKKEKRRLLKSSGSNNLVTGLQKSLKQAWNKRKSKKVRERTEEEALFRHALKVACYKGHKRVVSQLARRRRLLDLCDTDNKTALIHAIQYEQEECAAILLEHGADPNVIDIHGNTALHYAVLSENTTIVEKLVSCMANLEVRNKDDFTPLSLAKHENKEKMVEFLVTRGLKDHQVEGIQQATSENKEERSPMKSSDSNNLERNGEEERETSKMRVREISEEESLHSKNRIAVSCPTSDNVVFKVEKEEEEKSSERETSKSMHDGADNDSDDDGLSQHSNREQSDNQQPKDNINENAVILMNKVEEQEKKTSSKSEVSGNMHDGAEENSDNVGVRQKGNMEQSEKQQVPIKEKENSHRHGFSHWCCGFYRKRRIAVACPTSDNVVFKVKEKNKQTNSQREVSENVYDGANEDSDKNGLRQQINSEQTDFQQLNCNINENTAFLVDKVKEKENQKSSKREASENIYDGADDDNAKYGLSKHSIREQTDNQHPNDNINENAVILMNKVGEQEKKTSSKREVSGNMHVGAEDSSDSVGVRQKSNMEQSEKQQVSIKEKENSHRHGFPHWFDGFYSKRHIAVACPTLDNVVFKVKGENKQRSTIKEVSGNIYEGADDHSDRNGLTQQSNSQQTDTQQSKDEINENTVFFMNKVEEKKEQKNSKREESGNMGDGANDDTDSVGVRQKSNSEQSDKHQFPIVENEDSDRLTLQEEKEKRQKADLLSKKNTGQSRKKERQSIKNVEMNPKVANTTGTQVMLLKTVRGNTVSDSDAKEKRLLRENRMLKNKIAMLTLELDTVKNQNPEMVKKKDFLDIVIVKEKIDHLEKTITETLFQLKAELEVMRAELTMLSSKLEDERQNRGRLEAKGESHRSRLATVVQDHEHCQILKGDLQVDFKKEKEEWICSQDKNKSDMSNLKCDFEILSQKFSILESKYNRLEIELHHTRDALRERALVLEDGERDQSQTQCQKEETENVSQKEQGKVNADIGKQESLQQRLSHLQSENKWLQEQLDQTHNESDSEEETVIRMQDQFVDTIKILQTNSEKQGLMLNETCKELINECHLFKESGLQYENDKTERDEVVRQLQGELADTQRKQRQLQGELSDSQRKRRQLHGELSDSQRKRRQLQGELADSQRKRRQLQGELDDSQRKRRQLQGELADSQRKRRQLQGELDDSQRKRRQLQGELDDSQRKRRQLQGELDDSQRKRRQLQGELADSQRKRRQLQGELDDSQRKRRQLQGELDDSQRKRRQLQGELDDTQRKRRQLQGELDDSQRKRRQLQGELDDSQRKRRQLQGELDDSQRKRRQLQGELADSQRKRRQLQGELDDSQRKRRQLQGELDDTQRKRRQLQGELDDSQRTLRQLQGELADSQRKRRQLQGELDDSQRTLRQLQGELADSQRELFMTDASLKIESHRHMRSRYKIQELQKELDESRSQCQHEKEESKKYIDLTISLQQSLHEVMKQKSDLEKSMARFQEPLNMPKRNLNEDLSFPRDLRPSLTGMGMQTSRLIQESEEPLAASTSNHSPEDNTAQLEEEFKVLQKKCDEMTARAECWEQEGLRVRRQMKINRAKHLEEEQRLDRIGECARPDIAYRSEQIRQFYQDFFAL